MPPPAATKVAALSNAAIRLAVRLSHVPSSKMVRFRVFIETSLSPKIDVLNILKTQQDRAMVTTKRE